jgi:hypothetical protein
MAIAIKLQVTNQPFKKLFWSKYFKHKIIFKHSILLIAATMKLIVKLVHQNLFNFFALEFSRTTWTFQSLLGEESTWAQNWIALVYVSYDCDQDTNEFCLKFLQSRMKHWD